MNKTLILTPIIAVALAALCYIALGRFSWWIVVVFFMTAPVIIVLQYLLSVVRKPQDETEAKPVPSQTSQK